ncbi:polyketide synthase [Xylographa trunciseda]|nr:polyketide synthase [Xylographa trunciseda]
MSVPLQDIPRPQRGGEIPHSTASVHESSTYHSDDTKIEHGQKLPPTPPADTPLSVSSSPSPETDPDVSPNASPFKHLVGWRLVVVEACLCLGLLLSIVDSSIVATALVNIEDYFNDFFDVWILAAAILSTLFTGFPLFLTIIAIPERYQIVNGDDATSAGVRMMPLLFASAFGSTVGGLFSSRKNRTFVTLLAASCLMVVGCALLSTASDGLEIETALYGFQVVFGLGLGTTFTTVTIIASTESKFADYSIALGAVNQARIFGGTIGLAASTIILNIRLDNELQDVLSASQLINLRQSLNYIPSLDPAQQLAVAQTFAKSFNDQLRDCTYVAAACVVISLFTYSRHPTDLSKRKERGEALLAGRITLAEADA